MFFLIEGKKASLNLTQFLYKGRGSLISSKELAEEVFNCFKNISKVLGIKSE
jgi:hypothetical protein